MNSPLITNNKPSITNNKTSSYIKTYGYIGKDPTNASCISSLFYLWAYRIIKLANLIPLKPEYLGKLTGKYTSRNYIKTFKHIWETKQYKTLKSNALIKAGFRANLSYTIFVFISCITRCIINLTLVYLFRQYIRGFSSTPIPYANRNYLDNYSHIQIGIMYLLIRLFEIIIMRRSFTYQRMLGLKTGGELHTIIFDKILKVSPSSISHKSKIGEITNFIQVDAHKFQYLILSSPDLIVMPFTIITYSYMLFNMLGNAFFVGLVTMFMSFGFNFIFSKSIKALHAEQMKLKDERMKITTETFEHLKLLKMYAWENEFLKRINHARENEIRNMIKKYNISNITNTFAMLAPVLISVTSIGAYQYWYDNLVIEDVFTSISMFATLQFPLRSFPWLINNWIETAVSMKRIEMFLNEDEVKECNVIVNDRSTKEKGIAVKIENGCYSWGVIHKQSNNSNNNRNSSYDELSLSEHKSNRSSISSSVSQNEHNNNEAIELTTVVVVDAGNSNTQNVVNDKDKHNKHNDLYIKNDLEQSINNNNHSNPPSLSHAKIVLKDINLEIHKGEFICIIGNIGSGKTSLINAILNNLIPMNSHTKTIVNGDIAYVSQKPWIQNATVRDNILFFKQYDPTTYNTIIHLTELQHDLNALIGGDLTEIGERGINLSGGQKARVCLARALYADKDIYIFDDPVSALDAHVGMKIMDNCINGYLKHKTRILITHALQYIAHADRIVYMKEGKVYWIGTYSEIKAQRFYTKFVDKMQHKEQIQLQQQHASEQQDNTQLNKGVIKRITKDEDNITGKVSLAVYTSFITLIGGWCVVCVIILLIIINHVFKGISDIWLGYWSVHQSKDKNNTYFAIYTTLSVCACVFSYFLVLLQSKVSINSSRTLHTQMITSLIRAPISTFHETVPKGQIINRLSNEINNMDNWCSNDFIGVVTGCISLITAISICAIYQPLCLLYIPVLGVIGYKVALFYVKCSREIQRMESISRSPVLNVVNEAIPGTTTIRAFRYGDKYKEMFYDRIDDQMKMSLISIGTSQWFDITLDFISFAFIASLIVFTMLFKYKFASDSIGILFTYCINFQHVLTHWLYVVTGFENSMVSLERCLHYTKCPSERVLATTNNNNDDAWPSEGRIKFINYSVRYRPDTEIVLKDLNIEIHAHEKVGIVGRTGSGKSTISLCLLRMIEALKGKIYIDDVDISTIDLCKLRSKLTVIPQDPTLMQGTLRFNIDPMKLYSDNEIINVLRMIDFEYVVNEHPLGLQREITEGGDNLSVGEKQLVCIARAMLRRSKVVVLDESTASVDYHNEEVVQKAINNVFSMSTVITIAHRIKTVVNCDRVVVVDNGEVVEFDSPKEMIKRKKGLFYELYKSSDL